ncbi:MAG: hypothetical protein VX583_09520 [Bdellovibrionota bacterium]|nr:hypothetical protein [Pseudobdellovibrionaceae bacterium]|tara:strand:+ start:36433 stop:36639 length:207 start_codon:yes stop_codon:yes gene_type:complete
MQKIDQLIIQLNELKSGLINQIDNIQSSAQTTKKNILDKRKALLKLELNLQKLKSVKLKQKSKKINNT